MKGKAILAAASVATAAVATWSVGQRSVDSLIAPTIAVSALAAPAKTSPVRTSYPYSVVPYGVQSVQAARTAMESDPVVARAYRAGYPLEEGHTDEVAYYYVQYRKSDKIYWTAGKRRIPAGERVIRTNNDGLLIRQRCGNTLSLKPRKPILPAAEEQPILDQMTSAETPGQPPKVTASLVDLGAPDVDVSNYMPGSILPGGTPSAGSSGAAVPAVAGFGSIGGGGFSGAAVLSGGGIAAGASLFAIGAVGIVSAPEPAPAGMLLIGFIAALAIRKRKENV